MRLILTFFLVLGVIHPQSIIIAKKKAAPSGTAFISGQTLGTLRNDFSGCVGFRLSVGASPITVSQLGRWVVSGNSGTHNLYIKDAGGSTIISTSINTSGQPAGAYAYVSITPTALSASTDYFIMSEETGSGDQWYDTDTVVTPTAVGTVVGSSAGCGSPGTNGTANRSYVPVNFKY